MSIYFDGVAVVDGSERRRTIERLEQNAVRLGYTEVQDREALARLPRRRAVPIYRRGRLLE